MEESNKLSCVIALNSSEYIFFLLKDLTYINTNDDDALARSTHDIGFSFDKITEETSSYYEDSDTESVEEDWIAIKNTVEELSSIYQQATQKNVDITKCIQFIAISKYFESCVKDICDPQNTKLDNLNFIFIVPNGWSDKTDIVLLVLAPLLQNLGIKFHENPLDRIICKTQLEAALSYLQLESPKMKSQPLPAFVQNANQCILYDIAIDDRAIKQQSVYFQLKESRELELYNGAKFYTPKVVFVEESQDECMIDFDYVKDSLDQLIFEEILNEQLIMKSSTAVDKVRDNVFYAIKTFLNTNTIPTHPSLYDLKEYISKPQIELLFHSKNTIKRVLEHLKQLLSNQLQTVLNYIITQNNKVPYFRKSIILNYSIDSPWLKYEIPVMFVDLLFHELKNRYQNEDPTKFYLFDGEHFYLQCRKGVCLYASMKLMSQNIMLPPVFITKDKELNSIGLPKHVPVDQPEEYKFKPDVIVFIDISLSSTSVTGEKISQEGLTIEKFDIDIEDINEELLSVMAFLANRCINFGNSQDILDFSEFRYSKVEKLMFTAIESKKATATRSFTTLLNKVNKKEGMMGNCLIVADIQSNFANYINELANSIQSYLKDKSVQLGSVGYVLCIEKQITSNLLLEPRIDLSEFVKKNTPLNMIVVDQGEKELHGMLQKSQLPPSFYVHAHIQDSYIYLKLHQVVDTAGSNFEVTNQPTVLIKDRKIMIRNIHDQVCEILWNHIQSLDGREKEDFIYLCDSDSYAYFDSFKDVLISFMKEKLFLSADVDIYRKYTLLISDGAVIVISAQQVLEIAIIPVLKQLFALVISSLTNDNIFGFYEIANLFVTGKFLELHYYSEFYQFIITTEARKICEQMIFESTYRTKVDICIDSNASGSLEKKCFCYDTFLKGELCVVFSSTYFIHLPDIRVDKDWTSVEIDSAIKCGSSSSLMLQGERLRDKTIQVKSTTQGANNIPTGGYVGSSFFKYHELQGEHDPKHPKYSHVLSFSFSPNIMEHVLIEILHHSSSIKITSEVYSAIGGLLGPSIVEYFISERFTLKYF